MTFRSARGDTGPFRIFTKIREDIRSSRFFDFKFTLRCLQPDIVAIICHRCQRRRWRKFAAGVVDTGGNLPPVSLTPVANLPPVSTKLAKMVEKFATGAADTGGKFATGVVDTGGNFATGVVDTGGNFAAGVVDTGGKLPLVSLIPVVHLDSRISQRIFEKI